MSGLAGADWHGAGFLPMFVEYGGRYFMHTLQVWAVIGLNRFVSV